jgi:RNA polymerase sigma-70 factor (ECF subfamily)
MQAMSPSEITRLLQDWQGGQADALDRLLPLVYEELHALAARQLAREWRDGRMQTTVVVHEAYLKLFGQRDVDWQNRGHFFAIAAQIMRRILIDHARHDRRQKRGGDAPHLNLDAVSGNLVAPSEAVDAIALDAALQELERLDPRQGRIVEMRFFGGLTLEETAAAMGISTGTVKREWVMAKGFLHRALTARA